MKKLDVFILFAYIYFFKQKEYYSLIFDFFIFLNLIEPASFYIGIHTLRHNKRKTIHF